MRLQLILYIVQSEHHSYTVNVIIVHVTVHCRGVGCVLFEMATGQPLFPGSAIENQLELIFRTLGTPTEASWPGIASYKSFEPYRSPCHKSESLVSSAPRYANFCHTVLVSKTLTLEHCG